MERRTCKRAEGGFLKRFWTHNRVNGIIGVILTVLLMTSFSGFWPNAYARNPRTRSSVFGRFVHSNNVDPIAYALVDLFRFTGPLQKNEKLASGYTDPNGWFRFDNIPIWVGVDDIFARCYSMNWVADVMSDPWFLLGGTYDFRTGIFKDVPPGDLNLGETACHAEDDGAFRILNVVTKGWGFFKAKTGLEPPQTKIYWSSSFYANAPYYFSQGVCNMLLAGDAALTLAFSWLLTPLGSFIEDLTLAACLKSLVGIHLKGTGDLDDGKILHEYGHFLMAQYADFYPPTTKLDHHRTVPSDVETAFCEGWADFFSAVCRQYWNPDPAYWNWPDVEADIRGEDVEGAVTGILWDTYADWTLDHPSRMGLGFGPIWKALTTYDPHPGLAWPLGADHPWNIREFWDGLRATCDPHDLVWITNRLYEIYALHGVTIQDNDLPLNPTTYTSSHAVNIASAINRITVVLYEAVDQTSGIHGYSIVWDANENTIPDDHEDVFSNVIQSPYLTSGHWYLHARAVDGAGRCGEGAFHAGPFYIVQPDFDPSVEPRMIIFDKETCDIRFKVRWYDPTGIYGVIFAFPTVQGPYFEVNPSGQDTDEYGNGMYWYDMPKSEWIQWAQHQIYWLSAAYYHVDTGLMGGSVIADDDTVGPNLYGITSSYDIDDTYTGNYFFGIKAKDSNGIKTVGIRYMFSDGDWSDWQPASTSLSPASLHWFEIPETWHPPQPEPDVSKTYWFVIPRSEWIQHVGSTLYFQVNATDNDSDRLNDEASTITTKIEAGTIFDDDVEGPTFGNPKMDYIETDTLTRVFRMQIEASDNSGVSAAFFRARTEDGTWTPWVEASGMSEPTWVILGHHPSSYSYCTVWYDIPFETWERSLGKTFYWQVKAVDGDNDRDHDTSESISQVYSSKLSKQGFEVSVEQPVAIVELTQTQLYTLQISNNGSSEDTYSLSLEGLDPACYSLSATSLTLGPGQSQSVTVMIHLPLTAEIKSYGFNVTVTSQQDSNNKYVAALYADVFFSVRNLQADVNRDNKVDIMDVAQMTSAFGSYVGRSKYAISCDMNLDWKIDIFDVALVMRDFGKTYP